MSITRAQVNGVEALAAWLNENAADFFSSVTYENDVLTATDKNDYIVMEICNTSNAGYLRAYRSESGYISANMYQDAFSGTIDIIKCDNGIIIDTKYRYNTDRKFGVLISPTNNDELAIIFSYGGTTTTSSNYLYTQLQHVAFGDSATMSTTTTFTPESGQQTNFCKFCTNADITDVSYTPKAFYLSMHSTYNSGIGKFLSGGKVYITNGYWAIDTEQTEEDAT